MAVERTLAIVKPDGVAMRVTGKIIQRYIDAGLAPVRARWHRFTTKQAEEFYAEHKDRFYFVSLVLMMTSGPCRIAILEGEDAIARVRALHGDTNPDKAAPGTIRHDFRSGGGPFNTVHASDSPEAVEREIEIAFRGTRDIEKECPELNGLLAKHETT